VDEEEEEEGDLFLFFFFSFFFRFFSFFSLFFLFFASFSSSPAPFWSAFSASSLAASTALRFKSKLLPSTKDFAMPNASLSLAFFSAMAAASAWESL